MPTDLKKPDWADFCTVGLGRMLLIAALVGIVIQYGQWAMLSFSPLKALQMGASKGDLGILTLCNMAPTILTAVILGRFYVRFGRRLTMAAAFILLIFSLALLPFDMDLNGAFWSAAAVGSGRRLGLAGSWMAGQERKYRPARVGKLTLAAVAPFFLSIKERAT